MQIILSSNNVKKLQELRAILPAMDIRSCAEFLGKVEILEDGTSFEENACLKASAIYQLLEEKEGDLCVLADDSGICVDALNAMPGIYSARFASIPESAAEIAQGCFTIPQVNSNDTQNNLKLLTCLEELDIVQSNASFICVIAVCMRIKGEFRQTTFRGECRGKVLKAPLNPQAFGYDPLFIPEGYTLTMDRLPEKNAISHRFLALQQFKDFLNCVKSSHLRL
ncbi:non-canonical purine NTP pyrophosphatase [Helicobacter salomonis]|uniref:non-canonical purine NTP pyrophosphatase n=1 Tax=Helicobacter salomonis TaxID=56878 RepID=UPI000CF1B0E3|nr:non-canonical purine NTP pyrophosphatase [Helicobacter salomonis]